MLKGPKLVRTLILPLTKSFRISKTFPPPLRHIISAPALVMTMPARTDNPKTSPRRPAREIIDAIVENMRASREPLKYSVLAPSRFIVYLHPSEFARLQDVIPLLQEEAARALNDELDRLNRQTRVSRWMATWSGQSEPAVRNPAGEWQIEFVAHADGELQEGDLLVDSQLVLPGRPELGVGERTRRIQTVRRGPETVNREQTAVQSESSTTPITATLPEFPPL